MKYKIPFEARFTALILFCVVFICGLSAVGCTDAENAVGEALGKRHHIKQFSGGVAIGEWDSTGAVKSEGQSDGYYFKDAASQKLIKVSGTVQITVID